MKPKHKRSRKKKRTHPSQMLSYSRYGYQKLNESDYGYKDPDSYKKELPSILINIQEEDINFSRHAFKRANQRNISRDDVVDIILNKMPLYIDKGNLTYDFKLVYSSYKDFNEVVVIISPINHKKILIQTVYGRGNRRPVSIDEIIDIEDCWPDQITVFLKCPYCGQKLTESDIFIREKCPHCEHPIEIDDEDDYDIY